MVLPDGTAAETCSCWGVGREGRNLFADKVVSMNKRLYWFFYKLKDLYTNIISWKVLLNFLIRSSWA